VVAVNLVFLIMGAAIVGVSTYGVHHSERIEEVVPKGSLVVALIAGLALMGVAVLGFLGLAGSKGCLGRIALRLYVTILFVLMIVFFAAGGAIVYATKFLKYDTSNPNSAVNKWLNKVYTECCTKPTGECWIPKSECYDSNGVPDFQRFAEDTISWAKKHFVPLAAVVFTVAVLQLITIISACTVISRGKMEEKRQHTAPTHPSHGYAPPGVSTVYVAVAPEQHYTRPLQGGESRFQ